MNTQASFSLLLPLLAILIVFGAAFWIWMLTDCLLNETDREEKRFKWALGIAFANLIGAGLYFVKRKLTRRRQS